MLTLSRRRLMAATLSASMPMLVTALPARADTYPSKPIRLIVPFAAGSQSDVITRTIAAGMAEHLGQQIVPENRPGAQGTLGVAAGAAAPADGYTIFAATNGSLPAATVFFKKLPYDPVRSFTHLGIATNVPWVLVVRPDFPARSVEELIAWGRANPGKLTTANLSGSSRYATHLFARQAGMEVVQVPYNATAQAFGDLRNGQLQFLFLTSDFAAAQEKGGQLRILGITTLDRWGPMPQLLPVSSVLPGFSMVSWMAISAPADLPKPVAAKLVAALEHALSRPAVRQRIESLGASVAPMNTEQTNALIRDELPRWARFAAETGIVAE